MPDSAVRSLRTLLVGIDGVSLEVLEARPDDVIPTLTSIVETGASGPLESQLPPWTPSAWPSLYTGVNPGKHGVYSFLSFDGYDWDVVNSTDVNEFSLWELLDRQGITSVLVNVPVTHPPAAIDGAIIPGYTAPERPTCHPEGILEEVEAAIGDYRVYPDSESGDRDDAIEAYRDVIRSRGDAFRYLVDRFHPEFGFVQFQVTDTVFHEYPDDEEIVNAVFAAVDETIATILDETDPAVVVLVSDHGIGPYDGYEFRGNTYLRERGLVETTAGAGGMPSWRGLVDGRTGAGDAGGPSTLARVFRVGAAVGLTSQRIQAVVRALGLEDFVLRVAPMDAIHAASETVDFARSTAYYRDRIEIGLRINLVGREPDGVVEPEDFETTRDELVEALSALRTPDGDPVFDAVLPREEVFHGPYLEDAPDIVTVPADFDQYLSASIRPNRFGPPSEPWNHKLYGVFAAIGDVDTDASVTRPHLLDVAPTVLATLGVPASDRMDGRVLPIVTAVGTETLPEYETETVGTDSAAVEQHLADLGYLER